MIATFGTNLLDNFFNLMGSSRRVIEKYNLLTEPSTSDSTIIRSKVKGCIISLIKMCIWETGKRINSQGKGFTYMRMVKSIKASLLRGSSLEEGFIPIRAGLSMMASGVRIEKMALESTPMPINRDMKETGSTAKSTVKELTTIKMEMSISESG
jgi:hypothetical protein